MVYVLADNIISPLGTTSEENYQAVKAGNSAIRSLCSHDGWGTRGVYGFLDVIRL